MTPLFNSRVSCVSLFLFELRAFIASSSSFLIGLSALILVPFHGLSFFSLSGDFHLFPCFPVGFLAPGVSAFSFLVATVAIFLSSPASALQREGFAASPDLLPFPPSLPFLFLADCFSFVSFPFLSFGALPFLPFAASPGLSHHAGTLLHLAFGPVLTVDPIPVCLTSRLAALFPLLHVLRAPYFVPVPFFFRLDTAGSVREFPVRPRGCLTDGSVAHVPRPSVSPLRLVRHSASAPLSCYGCRAAFVVSSIYVFRFSQSRLIRHLHVVVLIFPFFLLVIVHLHCSCDLCMFSGSSSA